MKKIIMSIGAVSVPTIPAVAHFVDGYALSVGAMWLPAVCGIVLGVGIVAFAHTSLD